jgi:RNA polymerase sigma-70 factor (ECF subfamily)
VQISELSAKIRNGDRGAFELLFQAMYGQLCAYAERFVGDADNAEEIVQDIFVRVWQKREQIDITYSIKSYLYQSVRNASLNQIKHENIVREHQQYEKAVGSVTDESDTMVTMELEERIRAAVESLPDERRRIFRMSRDEGLKYKEIAEQLNISVKTVENQIGRALKSLRTDLADYFVWLLIIYWLYELNFHAGWG